MMKEQRAHDQQANQQLMIQMMQSMFQGQNVLPQSQPTIPSMSPKLPWPPALQTHGTTQPTTTPISASQSDNDALVASMKKKNLATDDSTKRHKTDDNMNIKDHPPLTQTAKSIPIPTETMVDVESLPPPPPGGQH